MPLDPSFVGRSYPPTEPYVVGREKIREFAEAVGDPHPAYYDVDTARELGHEDVLAPPTFPVVVTLAASDQVVADPALGLDYSRVVHGDQRFVAERAVRAGDHLVVRTTVDAIRSIGGSDILSLRGEVGTVDGEHVCTAYSTLVARAPEDES
jgi:acyl dehydratase